MDAEDMLDEDFMFYLAVSERNWKNLKTEKEKELAQEWLLKLTAVRQTKAEKRDRNLYLSQLALALCDGELGLPFSRRPPEGVLPAPSQVFGPPQPLIEVPPEFRKVDKSGDLTTAYTSKDGRTYVATKSLGKDYGAYTYIGISLADTEPLWVGSDTLTGPCYGFERHFQKPQTLYSKPRPRPRSAPFTMEKDGGSGDSLDDTIIFTDYVTGAKAAQMSGTHAEDSQPSVEGLRKSLRRSTVGVLNKSFRLSMPEIPGKDARRSIEGPRKSLRLSGLHDKDFWGSVGVLDTSFRLPAEKIAGVPVKSPRKSLKGLDTLKDLTEEEDEAADMEEEEDDDEDESFPPSLQRLSMDTTIDAQIDVSQFYTQMIVNLDNSLSGKEDLNEYNKEKVDEIQHSHEKEMQLVEAAEKTREALLKKLKRVKEEESRVSEKIKKLETMLLINSSDTDDSVIETWKEACKFHDEKNLQLLEEVYNQSVRERVAEMMTTLKLSAVNMRGKHMKAQAAAALEDFTHQSEKTQAKIQAAEDLVDRIQTVLGQMVDVKNAGPREDPHLVQIRELAEQLQADVEQLTNIYNDEYDAIQILEQKVVNRSGENVFENPELIRLRADNESLRNAIKEKEAHLESK